MLEKTGIPSLSDIESAFPDEARLKQGPVAVIECFQEIPCNPCQNACRRNAIQPFEDITHLPKIITDNCNGCALCVPQCPGLAIMTVHLDFSEDKAMMSIPYEFKPLPKAGETVKGLDRSGKEVAPVQVVKVLDTKITDKTPVISFVLDKKYIKMIRNIGGVQKHPNEGDAVCE